MIDPTPDAIASARHAAGHTQAQAAASVGVPARQWQRWEAKTATMQTAAWWLYLLRTGQATLGDLPAIPRRRRQACR